MARLKLEHGEIDLQRECLLRDGATIPLTSREAALLRFLAARQGESVSRQALLVEVWGYSPEVVSRAVDNVVRRLRAKLERDPQQPRHLLTVFGEGYRLVPAAALAPPPPLRPEIFGRDADLAGLLSALAASRLVSVVGPGGIGKTRLAQAALDARGGVLVDCAAAQDLAGFRAACSRALGIRSAAALPAALARVGLLILDNCEQATDAARGQVRALLEASPQVVVLVTSRAPLLLPQERVVPLAPLSLPASVAVLRTRALARGITLADDAWLPALAGHLDGIPLALELAAARLGVLGPRALLARLRTTLDLLSAPGQRGRHATMRDTIAWSWSLLSSSAQDTLAACSVFRGGFSASAALEVIDTPDALTQLEALRQAGLLLSAPAPGGGRRLRVLETIRQFAAERLSDPAPLQARHAQVFARLPIRHHRAEHDNLRAAHGWALTHAPAQALALCEALSAGFRAHGSPPAWRRAWAQTLAAQQTPSGRAHAALMQMDARRRTGDPPTADEVEVVLAAAAAAPALAHLAARARARQHRSLGDSDGAERHYQDALLAAETPHARGLLLLEAGGLAADRQQHTDAVRRYRQARALLDEAGDPERVSRADIHLAMVLSEEGCLDEACVAAELALSHFRAATDRRGQGIVHSLLGLIALERSALDEAEHHIAESRALCGAVGARRFEAYGLLLAAMRDQQRGQLPAAGRRATSALRAFTALGDQRFAAFAQARRGAVRALSGDTVHSAADLAAARQRLEAVGNPYLLAGMDALDALLALAKGDHIAARRTAERLSPDAPSSFARMARALLHQHLQARDKVRQAATRSGATDDYP